MRFRHSLRFRLLVAFLLTGFLLGPVLAGLFLEVAYELEERAVGEVLEQRLQRVLEHPEAHPLHALAGHPGVFVLISGAMSPIFDALAGLPPGLYEYEPDNGIEDVKDSQSPPLRVGNIGENRSFLVAIGERVGHRYLVVEDLTALEHREATTLYVIGAATLVAAYLALWLGYYLSKRLLVPISQLAQAVRKERIEDDGPPLAPDYARDEVGDLAAALDRYRARVRDALRRERDFSSDASHELRNPLAVIASSAELLADEPGLPPRARRAAGRIGEAAAEMEQTVAGLLALTRETTAQAEPLRPVDIIAPIVEHYATQADPQVRIAWRPMADPTILAPAVAVQAIVGNLLRNALQNTPQGQIEVRLEDQRLVVTDTGIGIPAADLETVTQRGVRGSNALATDGSGIGLSLVSRLCDRYGWRLQLHSTLGAGTRVEWIFDDIS